MVAVFLALAAVPARGSSIARAVSLRSSFRAARVAPQVKAFPTDVDAPQVKPESALANPGTNVCTIGFGEAPAHPLANTLPPPKATPWLGFRDMHDWFAPDDLGPPRRRRRKPHSRRGANNFSKDQPPCTSKTKCTARGRLVLVKKKTKQAAPDAAAPPTPAAAPAAAPAASATPRVLSPAPLYVKTPLGTTHCIEDVKYTDTVVALLDKICAQAGLKGEGLRLHAKGKPLDGVKTLAQCCLRKEDTLHLVGRLDGGAGSTRSAGGGTSSSLPPFRTSAELDAELPGSSREGFSVEAQRRQYDAAQAARATLVQKLHRLGVPVHSNPRLRACQKEAFRNAREHARDTRDKQVAAIEEAWHSSGGQLTPERSISIAKDIFAKARFPYHDLVMRSGKSLTIGLLSYLGTFARDMSLYTTSLSDLLPADHHEELSREMYVAPRTLIMVPNVINIKEIAKEGLHPCYGYTERYTNPNEASTESGNEWYRKEFGLPALSNCGLVKYLFDGHADASTRSIIQEFCEHVYILDESVVDMERLGQARVVIGTESKLSNEIRKGTLRAEDFGTKLLDEGDHGFKEDPSLPLPEGTTDGSWLRIPHFFCKSYAHFFTGTATPWMEKPDEELAEEMARNAGPGADPGPAPPLHKCLSRFTQGDAIQSGVARQPVYVQTSVRKMELFGSSARTDEHLLRETRDLLRKQPTYQSSIFRFLISAVLKDRRVTGVPWNGLICVPFNVASRGGAAVASSAEENMCQQVAQTLRAIIAAGAEGRFSSQPTCPVKNTALRVEWIHHSMPDREKKAILKGYTAGDIDFLVGDRIICRGLTGPFCRWTLNLRDCNDRDFNSSRLLYQFVARATGMLDPTSPEALSMGRRFTCAQNIQRFCAQHRSPQRLDLPPAEAYNLDLIINPNNKAAMERFFHRHGVQNVPTHEVDAGDMDDELNEAHRFQTLLVNSADGQQAAAAGADAEAAADEQPQHFVPPATPVHQPASDPEGLSPEEDAAEAERAAQAMQSLFLAGNSENRDFAQERLARQDELVPHTAAWKRADAFLRTALAILQPDGSLRRVLRIRHTAPIPSEFGEVTYRVLVAGTQAPNPESRAVVQAYMENMTPIGEAVFRNNLLSHDVDYDQLANVQTIAWSVTFEDEEDGIHYSPPQRLRLRGIGGLEAEFEQAERDERERQRLEERHAQETDQAADAAAAEAAGAADEAAAAARAAAAPPAGEQSPAAPAPTSDAAAEPRRGRSSRAGACAATDQGSECPAADVPPTRTGVPVAVGVMVAPQVVDANAAAAAAVEPDSVRSPAAAPMPPNVSAFVLPDEFDPNLMDLTRRNLDQSARGCNDMYSFLFSPLTLAIVGCASNVHLAVLRAFEEQNVPVQRIVNAYRSLLASNPDTAWMIDPGQFQSRFMNLIPDAVVHWRDDGQHARYVPAAWMVAARQQSLQANRAPNPNFVRLSADDARWEVWPASPTQEGVLAQGTGERGLYNEVQAYAREFQQAAIERAPQHPLLGGADGDAEPAPDAEAPVDPEPSAPEGPDDARPRRSTRSGRSTVPLERFDPSQTSAPTRATRAVVAPTTTTAAAPADESPFVAAPSVRHFGQGGGVSRQTARVFAAGTGADAVMCLLYDVQVAAQSMRMGLASRIEGRKVLRRPRDDGGNPNQRNQRRRVGPQQAVPQEPIVVPLPPATGGRAQALALRQVQRIANREQQAQERRQGYVDEPDQAGDWDHSVMLAIKAVGRLALEGVMSCIVNPNPMVRGEAYVHGTFNSADGDRSNHVRRIEHMFHIDGAAGNGWSPNWALKSVEAFPNTHTEGLTNNYFSRQMVAMGQLNQGSSELEDYCGSMRWAARGLAVAQGRLRSGDRTFLDTSPEPWRIREFVKAKQVELRNQELALAREDGSLGNCTPRGDDEANWLAYIRFKFPDRVGQLGAFEERQRQQQQQQP